MLSVVTGDPREIADEMLTQRGRRSRHRSPAACRSASTSRPRAVYKRQVLELGGNDPIIVMEDADLDEAASLGGRGLVQEFRAALHGGQAHARAEKGRRRLRRAAVARTKAWSYGDPADPQDRHGAR
jgi:aldehyde dehydrogenase (NAD+)